MVGKWVCCVRRLGAGYTWAAFLLLFVGDCDILMVALPDQAVGPLRTGGSFLPSDLKRGGLPMMVTYSDLIQIGILIVGICGLFIQVYKKK